jgi:hypothetical protein
MSEQITIVGAGVPGAQDSYYSELINLPATGDDASPPVGEYTLVPEVGFIFFVTLASGLTVVLRTDDSPAAYSTILAAAPGMIWSDGSNVFIQNANAVASPPDEASYYVLARKP